MPGTQGSESFDSEKNGRGFIFCDQRMKFSADFEHKRGVPGKVKTENFGCFMAFPRFPNSPNREFKTKKTPEFFRAFSIHKSLHINKLKQKWQSIFMRIKTYSLFL